MFKTEFIRTIKSILIWSFLIVILAVFGLLEYPFISQYMDDFSKVFEKIPKIVQIMFGIYQIDFSESMGYYACMYYWTCLMTYPHAVYTGASIISKDQRDKYSDYIYTKPFARGEIVLTKVYVGVINIFIINIVSLLSSFLCIMPIKPGFDIVLRIILCSGGMFVTQLLFMAIGLICSAIFSTYKNSVRAAMVFLLFSYSFGFFIEAAGNINFLNFLTPTRYFPIQSGIKNEYNFIYLVIAGLIIFFSVKFTQTKYGNRDFI